MTTAYLTRAVHFSASHRYHRPDWSEEDNLRRFGPAAWAEGHGHNYRVEVTVYGPIEPETGMVADLAALDALLESEVRDTFHHRRIDAAVEAFAPGAAIPTTENLAAHILARLRRRLADPVKIHRVRVREDRDLWSEVYADDVGDEGAAAP